MVWFALEIAKSNRSECVKCNKKINRGSKRLKLDCGYGRMKQYPYTVYVCEICAVKELEERIIELTHLLNVLYDREEYLVDRSGSIIPKKK